MRTSGRPTIPRIGLARVGAIALFLLLSSTDGCYSNREHVFDRTAPLERITAIRTRSGEEIPFATTGATVRNDTLFAVGRAGPVNILVDSVSGMETSQLSTSRTVALGLGIAATALAFAIVATLSNLDFPP
jgi:hypothetical protein